MMIEKYISDLLYRYQCVTVSGFGAFIAENQSAQICETTNTFIPPQKIISFNPNIKNNDGLLANHIAVQENIGYEKALEKIVNQVSFWNLELEKFHSISLKNIGKITLNSESKLVFENTNTVNYLTSSFGLSSFVASKINREPSKQAINFIEDKQPIPLVIENKKKYGFVKYAAIITLFIGGGTISSKIYYDQLIEKQTLLVQKQVQEKVQNQIQQATFFIETPALNVELPVKEEKLPYHLIAGAFRNEENADKALNLLITQGFNAKKLQKNKYDLIPVAYGSFKTLEEAKQEKLKLKNEANAEAWLFID